MSNTEDEKKYVISLDRNKLNLWNSEQKRRYSSSYKHRDSNLKRGRSYSRLYRRIKPDNSRIRSRNIYPMGIGAPNANHFKGTIEIAVNRCHTCMVPICQ